MKYSCCVTTLLCGALYSSAYAQTLVSSIADTQTMQIAVNDADRWAINQNYLAEEPNASSFTYQQLVFVENRDQSAIFNETGFAHEALAPTT